LMRPYNSRRIQRWQHSWAMKWRAFVLMKSRRMKLWFWHKINPYSLEYSPPREEIKNMIKYDTKLKLFYSPSS
jgi:hypothetical protein